MRSDELKCGDRAAWRSPWTGGCRLISLWDMKEYLARKLVDASASLAITYMNFLYAEDKDLTEEKRRSTGELMQGFYEAVKFLGLVFTAKAAGRFVSATKTDNSNRIREEIR